MKIRLIELAIMNIKATFKRNLIYGLIFIICLTLLISVITYWSKLYFSFDQYLNSAEEVKHYRQCKLLKDTGSHIKILNGISGIESIEKDTEQANAFIITVKDYRIVEKVLAEIENLDIGAVERDSSTVIDKEMLNMIKTGMSVVLVMIILFMTLIIRINISQSLDDRYHEIAIYKMVGYSSNHISALLLFENLILLLGGFGAGYLLSMIIAKLIIDPKINSLSGDWLNLLTLQDRTYLLLVWMLVVLLYLSLSTVLAAKKNITKISPVQLIK